MNRSAALLLLLIAGTCQNNRNNNNFIVSAESTSTGSVDSVDHSSGESSSIEETVHWRRSLNDDNVEGGAISVSSLSKLINGDALEIFRSYTTFYQQQVGILPEDIVLTYGAPCNDLPKIDNPLIETLPYTQNTIVYSNVSLQCEDYGNGVGYTWGGITRGWPRGVQAVSLLYQYGGMVRKELEQRVTHLTAVLLQAVSTFEATTGKNIAVQGTPTNAEEWTLFWNVLEGVSLTPIPGLLPYGIAPSPESIMKPYNQNGPVADFVPEDVDDPMTDEFLENNVGNAYGHEWVSYKVDDLVVAYPEVTQFPRFEMDGTYVALDLARWMTYTGKYQTTTNFTLGVQFPFNGQLIEVTNRDLPVLIVRHRAPNYPRPFQVIGIIMTSYDDMNIKTLYYPSDGIESVCDNTWTIAKMQFNSAYITFMAISHFYQTHYYPFGSLAIGLERVMNRAHPISRLLHPSSWRNLGIAWNGITNVFDGTTGTFSILSTISGPDIVKYFYPEFEKIEEYNLASPMSVYRQKLAPEVRKDMKIVRYSWKYFKAFKRFAKDFVNTFYETDQDLLNDYEIQNLASELTDPNKANLNAYGYLPPTYFQSKKSLIQFIARSLYAQGFLHHVMNHKLLSHLGLMGFPYRLFSTHKYYFPNIETGEIDLIGIPPQVMPSELCSTIDVTDYTGLSLFDDIPDLAPQTFTYFSSSMATGAGFKPTFFDLQDLHVFGYPHEQYAAIQHANRRLFEKLTTIDQQIFENESNLTLREGAFIWTPAWGTVTQPVI